jgi:hypothetical protein
MIGRVNAHDLCARAQNLDDTPYLVALTVLFFRRMPAGRLNDDEKPAWDPEQLSSIDRVPRVPIGKQYDVAQEDLALVELVAPDDDGLEGERTLAEPRDERLMGPMAKALGGARATGARICAIRVPMTPAVRTVQPPGSELCKMAQRQS